MRLCRTTLIESGGQSLSGRRGRYTTWRAACQCWRLAPNVQMSSVGGGEQLGPGSPGDAEVGEQERDRLGGRGSAVGVDGQVPGLMCCLAQVATISFPARAADRGWQAIPAGRERRGRASRFHAWFGEVALSSGLTATGRVACRRLSLAATAPGRGWRSSRGRFPRPERWPIQVGRCRRTDRCAACPGSPVARLGPTPVGGCPP